MKLRQILAVGAASALLTPAFGVLAATPAAAVVPATLQVTPPKAVGVNAKPVEFDVKIGNQGGDTHTDARLFLAIKLSETFGKGEGKRDPNDLRIEFQDEAGKWQTIKLSGQGDELTGSPDRKFLAEAKDETLKLRVAVADGAARKAGASAKASLTGKAVAPAEADPCSTTFPGFTLGTALKDVDQSGTPVGNPIATDSDEVKLGLAAVAFTGLAGDITVGATPKPFTLTVCNTSDSTYDLVAVDLFLLRGDLIEPTGTLKATDVVLEIAKGNTFAPVPVQQGEDDAKQAAIAVLAGADGKGFVLPANKKEPVKLRLGFKNGTTPGKGSATALVVLPEAEQFGGRADATFAMVAPKPPAGQSRPNPELPDTGGNISLAMLGAGLLVAGAGAIAAARRRRGNH